MKKARLTALFLAALMLTSTLAACSDGEKSNAAVTTVATEDETTTFVETTPLDNFKDFDGKEAEFHIMAHSVDKSNPSIPEAETTGESVLDAMYYRDRKLEELYNIKIVYAEKYKSTDIGTRTTLRKDLQNLIMAEDCQYHMIITSMADGISALAPNGDLYDLNSIPQLSLDQPWWSQNMYKNFTYNDRLFVTSGPLTLAYYYSPCVLAYNQKLANDYGIEDLYQLVLDGKWTFDKFAELVTDRSTDLNGDGKITEADMYACASDELSAASFYIGLGGRQDVIEDGVPVFKLGEEDSLNRLTRVSEIIGNKDITLRTEQVGGHGAVTANKTWQFKIGQSLFVAYNMSGIIAELRDMEDDYGILPMPKWDEEQENYYTYGSPWGPVGIAVPVTGNDIEMTGVIMESMAYLSYQNVGPRMFELTLKEKVARDENSKAMLDIIYSDIIYDWTGVFGLGASMNVRDFCIGKTANFVSTWESNRVRYETDIQKILEAYDNIENG